ncbi:MAG: hypothetical protein VKL42_15790 [Snowella sp.]|nr:hypothetical protein [Snowella sp.]
MYPLTNPKEQKLYHFTDDKLQEFQLGLAGQISKLCENTDGDMLERQQRLQRCIEKNPLVRELRQLAGRDINSHIPSPPFQYLGEPVTISSYLQKDKVNSEIHICTKLPTGVVSKFALHLNKTAKIYNTSDYSKESRKLLITDGLGSNCKRIAYDIKIPYQDFSTLYPGTRVGETVQGILVLEPD